MTRILFGFLVLLSHSCVLAADQPAADLYPAVSKDKTGYINQEGKVLIPFVFEEGREFSQGLAAVLMDGKWGYINEKAEIVIKPLYQDAGNFSEDMAYVQVKGKYGYVNREGKVVIEPRYRNAGAFSEGFAVVPNDRGKTFLIDKAGKAALNPDVYGMALSGFSEGLVFGYVKRKPLTVYMDKDGKIAISIEGTDRLGTVAQSTAFSEGLAAVRIKGKWGYIDRTGEMVIAPEYMKVTPFQQGLACVAVEERKDGVGYRTDFIIDRKGTKIKQIPVTSRGFSEGLVPFGKWDKGKREPKYGYLDTQGEVAIQSQFDRALPFQKGLARVQIRGANAYIDKQGRPVWIGEVQGDERVTSYSGKSMINLYSEMLREENWRLARFYIQKMNRKELVEGSRITLKWLLENPKRAASRDIGRSGMIGMVAVAPFLETYSRSFIKEDKPIDLSPFRSMLIDRSLDIDFRKELANCIADDDFYQPSWEQISKDTQVLNKLVCDPSEGESLRIQAAKSAFRFISRFYWQHRRETMKNFVFAEAGAAKYPDIVAMLGEAPCPFSPKNKTRWELLVKCMEKSASDALKLYEEAQIEKVQKSVYRLLKEIPKYHLLRDKELLKRVEEIKTKEEKAKAKSSQNNP